VLAKMEAQHVLQAGEQEPRFRWRRSDKRCSGWRPCPASAFWCWCRRASHLGGHQPTSTMLSSTPPRRCNHQRLNARGLYTTNIDASRAMIDAHSPSPCARGCRAGQQISASKPSVAEVLLRKSRRILRAPISITQRSGRRLPPHSNARSSTTCWASTAGFEARRSFHGLR